MRVLGTLLLGFGLIVAFMGNAQADDKEKDKEVTLKGLVCCPKCELDIAKKCYTLVVVKEKDKELYYYFDLAGHKKYHKEICTKAKKAEVVGVVGKEGKKLTIKVSKVTFE